MSEECELAAFEFEERYKRRRGVDMLTDFYVPMLQRAETYDRVSGYFSSAVISRASAGFAKFCSRGNHKRADGTPRFRLIVGARLNTLDEQTILSLDDESLVESEIEKSVIDAIEKIAEEVSNDSKDNDEDALKKKFERDRLSGFTWMLKQGILEIKVGVRYDEKTRIILRHQEAEFHEKYGIVSDNQGCRMSFKGSANETRRGWLENRESIDVFRSWQGEENRIGNHQSDFDDLWGGGVISGEDVAIYTFSEAAKMKILETFPPSDQSNFDELDWAEQRKKWMESASTLSEIMENKWEDEKKGKWRHQEEAVNWFVEDAGGVGIFQMATGSGKTWTSMKCMRRMLENKSIDKVIITMPNSILPQWKDELKGFLKMKSVPNGCINTLFEYSSSKKEHLAFKRAKSGAFLVITHSFLLRFLKIAKNWQGEFDNTLLVVDELHRIGADRFTRLQNELMAEEGEEVSSLEDKQIDLSENENALSYFRYRLGLSATPWTIYDDDDHSRNKFLVSNFTNLTYPDNSFFSGDWEGKLREEPRQVFYFGLDSGIERGILCEFDYVPLEYTPTDEEIKEYNEIVSKGFGKKDDKDTNEALAAIRASAVFKGSRNKLPVFFEWLEKESDGILDRSLIFVVDTGFGRDLMSKLNSGGRSNFASFFMGDPDDNLRSFAKGETHFLVSCHRISEGLDIQSVRQIVLFSFSGSPLETIQRIGRALRKGDDPKRALVVDFIYDNPNSSTNPDAARREWLKGLAEAKLLEE